MAEPLLRTPLFDAHLKLKARMVPFAGYEMPVQYTGLLEEAKACRSAMGLFDVSHMGQFRLRGKNPLVALQALVTNDLSKIQMGQAQYNMLCTPTGGVIDDLIIYRKGDDETYICVNAGNRVEDLAWMQQHLAKTIELVDESEETGLIAIQGPKAEAFLSTLGKADVIQGLKYYTAIDAEIAGIPTYLSRTGYTGEDGYEIYVKNADCKKLWDRLLNDGAPQGLTPCGLGARDTLRLEMGYPLHGHELSKTITPLEAGLNWVVKLTQAPDFIGKAALQKQATEGPRKILKAFVVEDKRIARQGYPICDLQKKVVGEITSGTQSPHLGKPIAMGFVNSASTGNQFLVQVRNDYVPATVTALPFVPSKAKKNVK